MSCALRSAGEVPVFARLRSSCKHVTELRVVRLALEFVMQTEGDFVDVIVLHSLGQYAQDTPIMND
jgi:hypothetical protein